MSSFWPGLTDYFIAVQNPKVSFQDPDLREAAVIKDDKGKPRVAVGSFASVYGLSRGGRSWAVRCFQNQVKDQQRRYELLSTHLAGLPNGDFLVGFKYIKEGILVNGAWFPIVKMDWVHGQLLHGAVQNVLNYPGDLLDMAKKLRVLVATLHGLNMAHGDLQHGNILVTDSNDYRLVDYDGMFVPAMKGENSPEGGHPNFAHPLRKANHFDATLDNFPVLVIFLSLRALAVESGLWAKFNVGENLLLTEADFKDPHASDTFKALRMVKDPFVQKLASDVMGYCSVDPCQVPRLEEILPRVPGELFPKHLVEKRGAHPSERESNVLPEGNAGGYSRVRSVMNTTPASPQRLRNSSQLVRPNMPVSSGGINSSSAPNKVRDFPVKKVVAIVTFAGASCLGLLAFLHNPKPDPEAPPPVIASEDHALKEERVKAEQAMVNAENASSQAVKARAKTAQELENVADGVKAVSASKIAEKEKERQLSELTVARQQVEEAVAKASDAELRANNAKNIIEQVAKTNVLQAIVSAISSAAEESQRAMTLSDEAARLADEAHDRTRQLASDLNSATLQFVALTAVKARAERSQGVIQEAKIKSEVVQKKIRDVCDKLKSVLDGIQETTLSKDQKDQFTILVKTEEKKACNASEDLAGAEEEGLGAMNAATSAGHTEDANQANSYAERAEHKAEHFKNKVDEIDGVVNEFRQKMIELDKDIQLAMLNKPKSSSDPSPLKTVLNIQTTPDNCAITVDGVNTYTRSLELQLKQSKMLNLAISKEGYKSQYFTVELTPGETRTVSFVLEQAGIPSKVRFRP